jgi:Uracil DNA glycosylase superfamily
MSVRERPNDKIERLRREAASCQACPLWKDATQTVFGEGPPDAAIMLVGEQPGDREDIQGRPFVGPAGLLLDRALAEAGVDRRRVYVTNAVKHFKFEPRGKRRLHKRPNASEIKICRRWLFDEIEAIGRASSSPLARPPRRIWRDARSRFRSIAAQFSMWRMDCGCWLPFTRPRCCACRMRKRSVRATPVSSTTCAP